MVSYFSIEKRYLEKFTAKDMIILTSLLVITNAIKPNFVLSFSIVVLICLVIDFLKTRGRSLKANFKMGVCVLISCLVLLIQSSQLYPDGGSDGIALTFDCFLQCWLSWKNILGILISLTFPIMVFIWAIWKKKDVSKLKKIWLMFGISILIGQLLTETGERSTHGNFGWGSYCFGWYLMLYSAIEYFILIADKKKNKIEYILAVVSAAFLTLNIGCGMVYFGLLLQGQRYLV